MQPYVQGGAAARESLGLVKESAPNWARLGSQALSGLAKLKTPLNNRLSQVVDTVRAARPRPAPLAEIQSAPVTPSLARLPKPTGDGALAKLAPNATAASATAEGPPSRLQRNAAPMGLGVALGMSEPEADGKPSWGMVRNAVAGGAFGVPGLAMSMAYPYVRKYLSGVAPPSAPPALDVKGK